MILNFLQILTIFFCIFGYFLLKLDFDFQIKKVCVDSIDKPSIILFFENFFRV